MATTEIAFFLKKQRVTENENFTGVKPTHLRTSGSPSKQILLPGMQLCPHEEQECGNSHSPECTMEQGKQSRRSKAKTCPVCASLVCAPPRLTQLSLSQFPHQHPGVRFSSAFTLISTKKKKKVVCLCFTAPARTPNTYLSTLAS